MTVSAWGTSGGAFGSGYKAKTPTKMASIGSGIGGLLPNSISSSFNTAVPSPVPTYGNAADTAAAPQIGGSGGGGAGVPGDPRDPTYWTDAAKIKQTFDTNNAGYDLQDREGLTARDTALAKYDKEEPIATGNARGAYNNAGLFYSTRLGGAEADITSKFGEARTNTRAGYASLKDRLDIARRSNFAANGIDAKGNPVGTNYLEAYNAGVGRATQADTDKANANLLASLLAPPAPVSAPAATSSYVAVNNPYNSARVRLSKPWGSR